MRVGENFSFRFGVQFNDVPVPGISAGDFTANARNPGNTVDQALTVSEIGGGEYVAVLPAAFTTAQGVGQYSIRISVNSASPQAQGLLVETVTFESNDLDSIEAAVNAIGSTSQIVDAVWDENIVAAHGNANTAGLLLRALGADIANRSNNATLAALLDIPDTAGQDLSSAVDTALVAAHGAGSWQSATPPDAAAIADAVWDENIVAAHGTADTAGLLVRVLGADIADRVNNASLNALLAIGDTAGNTLPIQINTQLETVSGHGGGSWATAVVPSAVAISNAVWSEPIPGSFSLGEAGDVLAAAAVPPATVADAVWDENIVAAHVGASSAGLLLNRLGAAIATRTNNSNLNDLLGVADTASNDLPAEINNELEVVAGHGAGSWASVSSLNAQQVATAVWTEPVPGTFPAGSAAAVLVAAESGADIADAVWDEAIVGQHDTSGSAGRFLAVLAQGIADRNNNASLNDLLGVADSLNVDLPTQLNTHLETVAGHGSGAWTTASPPSAAAITAAVWGEAVPGSFGAGTAGNVLAQQPDPAPIADAVWDEDLGLAHGNPDTAGLALRVLGHDISNRTNNASLDDLLGVADTASRDLPSQINLHLESVAGHGAGAWITSTPPSTAAITAAVWGEVVPGSFPSGSAGNAITQQPDAAPIADAIWDEDVVAAHGTANTAGLLLRVLGHDISTRNNFASLENLLGVADQAGIDLPHQVNTELETIAGHGSGSWQTAAAADTAAIAQAVWSEPVPGSFGPGTAGAVLPTVSAPQVDVRQAWTRALPNAFTAIVHLELDGNAVQLDAGATLAYEGRNADGTAISGFSGTGTRRQNGSDTWFELTQSYTPAAGTVIIVRCTISNSGVGSGTHVGFTEIVFPEF